MRVAGLTIAIEDMPAMVSFYNAVFGCGLTEFQALGTSLYRGQIGGLPLVFCPNEIAGAAPGHGKHQLRLTVADVVACLSTAVASGGQVVGEPSQRVTGLRDPDGNTIEIVAEAA